MISVFETMNSIDRAGDDLRKDEDNLTRIIDAATAELAKLHTEEAALFKALAALRLDAIQQDQVSGRLDAVERQALAAMEERQARLIELEGGREILARDLGEAREARAESERKVEAAADAIQDLADATENRISGDLAWQEQSARVAGAQARSSAASEKATQSEADRDEKSKPYLDDPLFVYLWKRGYGTSRYAAGSLVRMGDDYVARVVQYEPARQNYYALTEIPKRLREHADRLARELAEEEAKLVALEREALEADGIGDRESAHAAAEAELRACDERIAKLEAEDRDLEAERAELTGVSPGSALSDALDELAASLKRQDLQDLLRDALDTPHKDDDQIVRRLQDIEIAMEDKQREIERTRQTALEIARKRAELDRSREEIRRQGYDRQGGGFSNEQLIGNILGGILAGALSSRDLGDAMRSGYRGGSKRARRKSRSRGGVFGGGFGGGGFGGGGSSGGGGFRTGGGF
ncbi:hypothetical protein [Breoghania sp.]|uniref:hypothetical protein n=1 Tax=Breoghania sp. TaxID=2065378 RepID=UPI002AA82C30|nr:hypothetical protein [Breoghania sp.]